MTQITQMGASRLGLIQIKLPLDVLDLCNLWL
ncbi:hypothetical protein Astex_1721 [Asticcacaulis excentricus CB 48]|uniref:Uncharacterized protein n=1 Tax=Asticcacaulis excentricus (strain ATCC 15261 / DSM 4724 / KCTC 12464 / NCIMB 9791 / VKM B-1370 / CB 48) TaxID=573065 RepID=E8RR69_ASTEC|nr:hypothetical protein Astex_1721 [Asticcacaulis excentricus CB 48]